MQRATYSQVFQKATIFSRFRKAVLDFNTHKFALRWKWQEPQSSKSNTEEMFQRKMVTDDTAGYCFIISGDFNFNTDRSTNPETKSFIGVMDSFDLKQFVVGQWVTAGSLLIHQRVAGSFFCISPSASRSCTVGFILRATWMLDQFKHVNIFEMFHWEQREEEPVMLILTWCFRETCSSSFGLSWDLQQVFVSFSVTVGSQYYPIFGSGTKLVVSGETKLYLFSFIWIIFVLILKVCVRKRKILSDNFMYLCLNL